MRLHQLFFYKSYYKPLSKEIDEWFIQTAPVEDQETEAQNPCLDCAEQEVTPIIEKEGWFSSVLGTVTDWLDEAYQFIFGEEDTNDSKQKPSTEDTSSNLQKIQSTISSAETSPTTSNPLSVVQVQTKDTPFIPLVCFRESSSLAPLKPDNQKDLIFA